MFCAFLGNNLNHSFQVLGTALLYLSALEFTCGTSLVLFDFIHFNLQQILEDYLKIKINRIELLYSSSSLVFNQSGP